MNFKKKKTKELQRAMMKQIVNTEKLRIKLETAGLNERKLSGLNQIWDFYLKLSIHERINWRANAAFYSRDKIEATLYKTLEGFSINFGMAANRCAEIKKNYTQQLDVLVSMGYVTSQQHAKEMKLHNRKMQSKARKQHWVNTTTKKLQFRHKHHS